MLSLGGVIFKNVFCQFSGTYIPWFLHLSHLTLGAKSNTWWCQMVSSVVDIRGSDNSSNLGVVVLVVGQGRTFQIWLGGLAPGFFNYGGGGGKLPPKSQTLGGKIMKVPTYLVLKGQRKIWPFLKPVFWTFHDGCPEKFFCKSKN